MKIIFVTLPIIFFIFRFKKINFKKVIKILFCFLLFLWGNFYTHHQLYQPLPHIAQQWVSQSKVIHIHFEALDYCRKQGKTYRFQAKLLGYYENEKYKKLNVGIQVRVKNGTCDIKPGNIYSTLAKFYLPRRYKNPSSFDYPFYLKTQGVDLLAYVLSERFIVTEKTTAGQIAGLAHRARKKVLFLLDENFKASAQVKGLFHALFLRNKGELLEKNKQAFHHAGLAHLLVVSGLHLAWVFLFFYLPFYWVLNFSKMLSSRGWAKWVATLLALLPVYFYVLMIGPSPPVLRAAMMIFVGSLLWAWRFRKDFFSVIFFCALTLLFINPTYLFDLSFQLSFLSLSVLYLSGKYFYHFFKDRNSIRNSFYKKVLQASLSTLFTSFVINLFLLPLTARYFHTYSTIAPVANLIVIPVFLFLLMPGLFFSVILSSFHLDAGSFLFEYVSLLAEWLLTLVEWLSALPGAYFKMTSLSWPSLAALIFLVLACFYLHKLKKMMALLFVTFFFLAGQSLWQNYFSDQNQLKITMIDVGQGESMLIQLPNQKNILIDGGGPTYGDFNLGEKVLVPELMRLGVKKLDAIFLTHADADHYRGLLAVLENFEVRQFCSTVLLSSYPEIKLLSQQIEEKKIKSCHLFQGQTWQEDDVLFNILWPNKIYQRDSNRASEIPKDNATSLVFKMCYQYFCFLLTGDIEDDVETQLVQSGFDLNAHVLKLAHHGSKTSSTENFLNAVNPQVAIVSAGYQNRFRHPHSSILKRLNVMKVPLLRTDQDGQIQIIVKDKKLSFETFLKKK